MGTTVLTENPIDIREVAGWVEAAGFGATVVFTGTVRDNARGRRVECLHYTAYGPLAEKELARIAAEAEARWGCAVGLAHRTGRLNVGECSIAIAVAAPHRAEAFEACRWLMDAVKESVPVWKKEYFEGGAHWVEGSEVVPSEP
jgi:molybdopterin synthase catalytic subunit